MPNAPVSVPAELPPRFAINFVPAINVLASPVVLAPSVAPSVAPVPAVTDVFSNISDDFCVLSSANFVPAFTSSSSIGTTQ